MEPKKSFLSDLNQHLIDCYKIVRDYPEKLSFALQKHKKYHSEDYYYKIRSAFNKHLGEVDVAQASRFIYLNRSSFNGIFRVNNSGYFNVPFDPKKNLIIPSLDSLIKIGMLFKKAFLICCDYQKILKKASKGDFIYLDPPYPPLNGTSFFTHYTKERFSHRDQEYLASYAKALSNKGCLILISNADTPLIRDLYSGWSIHSLEVTRYISIKSIKHKVNEVLITNYEVT